MQPIKFERILIITTILLTVLAYISSQIGMKSQSAFVNDETVFCTILPSSYNFAQMEESKWVGNSLMYWERGTQLKVYLRGAELSLQRKILEIANEWGSPTGVNFIRSGLEQNSQIRISFDCKGYNSLVGQQNLDPNYASKPTMCLQGLDKSTDPQLFRRTVLHEFGHVMGLLHELQNPTANIPWDTAKLYAYYKNTYNWDRDSVNNWVLNLYNDMQHGDFDSSSIMVYAVPDSLTIGNYRISWPNKLSQGDLEFIRQHY